MKRRDILFAMAASGLALSRAEAAEIQAAAAPAAADGRDRLWIRRDDAIRPEMDVQFRVGEDRVVDRDGMLRLSWFWRDIKDHERAVWVDPQLFDLLSRMQCAAAALSGSRQPIFLLSGYRTPERNRSLEGAALRSQHIFGRAADITISGFSPAQLGALAAAVGAGGVGLYSRFTHVDTGPVRAWGVARSRQRDFS
jgi:uncharacterized protein YcbK (DUF882 family)